LILTTTLNPSVDINYKLDELRLDRVNRTQNVEKTAGGKGLNVARVLSQLGENVGATGFLGGSLGNFIRKEIAEINIEDFFIDIEGDTRNCIAVIHNHKQTEILEDGPTIEEKEANLFLKKYTQMIDQFNLITVSGSLPKGLDDNYYNKILEISKLANKPVLLDTKGSLLKLALQSEEKPHLIKPNLDELQDLLGTDVQEESDIYRSLQDEMFDGIDWVVVTLGAEGAIVKHRHEMYRVQKPKIDAINPVGSGDSVIAGFAAGINQSLNNKDLIKYGLAMGTLNAMEEKTGCINKEKIDWCIESIIVEEIAIRS
jgi:tagatose 6-phosphate kinase